MTEWLLENEFEDDMFIAETCKNGKYLAEISEQNIVVLLKKPYCNKTK